jgi:hypothetical protein
MKLRFLQWNIRYNSDFLKIAELIAASIDGSTMVQLQEVTQGHFENLKKCLSPCDSAYSLDFRAPGYHEGKNRALGVATFLFNGIIEKSRILERSLFPERTLFVEAKFNDVRIRSLNFHSLTGVGYKHGKASNFATIADFLAENKMDLFSCDANEPMVDSIEIGDVRFFDNGDRGKCAALLFGSDKIHELDDVWRRFTIAKADFPGSPPISYVINEKVKKRYDFIYSTSQFSIIDVRYLLEDSIRASSDHALVIADFEIS